MATIDLGRLGFVNKGTYNNSTTYEKNDLVQFTDGGVLSTYLYIDSTAQSGQAPSSSGTAGSRWVYYAKGVADAVASAGNNKVLVTNASGNLTPLAIGSAGQVLKTNSGANGFEFGTDAGGGVKQVKTAHLSTNVGVITNISSYAQVPTNVWSLNFTPTSASNKVMLFVHASISNITSGANRVRISLWRDSNIVAGNTETLGSRRYAFGGSYHNDNREIGSWPLMFLDSPNTTSQVNYNFKMNNDSGSSTNYAYINRSSGDHNDGGQPRMTSSITAMEIDSGVL